MQVRDIIKERGYTVKDVAELMGVNRVTLSNMISGNPTYSTLSKIADAIGCKVGDFFLDEMSPKESMTALVKHGEDLYSAVTTDELRRIADEIDEKNNS